MKARPQSATERDPKTIVHPFRLAAQEPRCVSTGLISSRICSSRCAASSKGKHKQPVYARKRVYAYLVTRDFEPRGMGRLSEVCIHISDKRTYSPRPERELSSETRSASDRRRARMFTFVRPATMPRSDVSASSKEILCVSVA